MKITMHGAGQEVGRSCIEVDHQGRRIILDAGLKIVKGGNLFPTTVKNVENIQTVLISHAHLDHTGALPLLYGQGLRSAVYMSKVTKDILKILLKDSWKIAMIEKIDVGYKKRDIRKVLELAIPFNENDKKASFEIGGAQVQTYNAGHIPGSRSILLQFSDTTLLYTGDTSTPTTALTAGLDIEEFPKNVDVLIIESTYGGTDHPSREEVVEELLNHIKRTLENGGNVLVPTFSIGRAQELLIRLYEAKLPAPIYFDGMAKSITEIFLENPNDIVDPQRLANAYHNSRIVGSNEERNAALQQQSVIITTAGMLDGGPICHYIPKVAKDKKTAILLTGYQAEDSNGRRLLNEGFVEIDNKQYKIACEVKKYDLSGHAGKKELQEIIKHVKPKQVIVQHGEGEQIRALKDFVEKEVGAICHMPKTGETIDITKAP